MPESTDPPQSLDEIIDMVNRRFDHAAHPGHLDDLNLIVDELEEFRDRIRIRLVEMRGEIRRLENKDKLMGCASAEEYEVLDSLYSECDALDWVLKGAMD